MALMRWQFTAAGESNEVTRPKDRNTGWNTMFTHQICVHATSGNCACVVKLEGNSLLEGNPTMGEPYGWVEIATFTLPSAPTPQTDVAVAAHSFDRYRATCLSIGGTGAIALLAISA